MSEFTPITIESQEQLDGMFKDRLNRQSEKHSKEIAEIKSQFSDYETLKEENNNYKAQIETLNSQLSAANEKIVGYDSQMAEKDETISNYKINTLKSSILAEMNLPGEAINFLQGSDEDSIRANAESLKLLVTAGHQVAPLAVHESAMGGRNEALKQMLSNLH